MGALDGVTVLDFSTLLPGPLASLTLREAGARVIRIERPDGGDEMRRMGPSFGADGAWYALLNRGKEVLALDLKDRDAARAALEPLLREASILIEQFRPGVMERLGLGFQAVTAINPALVYCSITGYGQTGPNAAKPGHDLDYIAETGLLALAGGPDAVPPQIPPGLIADIGGGTLPALVNILLALREAEHTGRGRHLDIAMTDNLFAWAWWAMGALETLGEDPAPGGALLTGGSPRYRLYRTADGRYLAIGALEDRFWREVVAVTGLPAPLADDARDPTATGRALAERIAREPLRHWLNAFAGRDACVSPVATLSEAMRDPHFLARGLFERAVVDGAERLTALSPFLAPGLNVSPSEASYPRLRR